MKGWRNTVRSKILIPSNYCTKLSSLGTEMDVQIMRHLKLQVATTRKETVHIALWKNPRNHNKEKTLKSIREKYEITSKDKPLRITADFLTQIFRPGEIEGVH